MLHGFSVVVDFSHSFPRLVPSESIEHHNNPRPRSTPRLDALHAIPQFGWPGEGRGWARNVLYSLRSHGFHHTGPEVYQMGPAGPHLMNFRVCMIDLGVVFMLWSQMFPQHLAIAVGGGFIAGFKLWPQRASHKTQCAFVQREQE